MNIRAETPQDRDAIHQVHTAAFGQENEAKLVDALREAGGHLVSLVAATEAGQVVGHVLFTPVAVEGTEEIFECCALAPIGVLPAHQGQGIGSALVGAGMQACLNLGYDVIFVLGDPAYYTRFGFEPTAPHNIRPEFDDIPPENFMVALGSDDALADIWGTVYYLPAFKDA